MGGPYHQFCPVAKAMELLDERWTLLVVRELVCGSQRFNDLRRGLPRMSPTLLSKRLHQLVKAGVVERQVVDGESRYVLTAAGAELGPVIEALGAWGIRWIGHLGDVDLDPKLLLWDMHRNIDFAVLPGGRTVVKFDFTGVPVRQREWWLVIEGGEADVCDADPGFDIDATVKGSLRRLVQVWRGDCTWAAALASGEVAVSGSVAVRRGLPTWFTLSGFAAVPRPVGA